MTYPLNSAFNLSMPEKVMLRAFITGTKLNDPGNADSVWTSEALSTLNSILDGTIDTEPPSAIAQDLFCIFTDLILRKDLQSKDIEFARTETVHHRFLLRRRQPSVQQPQP